MRWPFMRKRTHEAILAQAIEAAAVIADRLDPIRLPGDAQRYPRRSLAGMEIRGLRARFMRPTRAGGGS